MDFPSNLGKWLIESKPSDDVLDELTDIEANDRLIPALLDILKNWDELVEGQSSQTAGWLVWKVFGYPFFLQHEPLNDDQTRLLVEGCERITLSIPRLHEPEAPMENGFFMLWDLYAEGNQLAFDALSRLVNHPDHRVQFAALHGLGHRGDARIPIIHKFIKKHPDLVDDDFVKQCLDGTVM